MFAGVCGFVIVILCVCLTVLWVYFDLDLHWFFCLGWVIVLEADLVVTYLRCDRVWLRCVALGCRLWVSLSWV